MTRRGAKGTRDQVLLLSGPPSPAVLRSCHPGPTGTSVQARPLRKDCLIVPSLFPAVLSRSAGLPIFARNPAWRQQNGSARKRPADQDCFHTPAYPICPARKNRLYTSLPAASTAGPGRKEAESGRSSNCSAHRERGRDRQIDDGFSGNFLNHS